MWPYIAICDRIFEEFSARILCIHGAGICFWPTLFITFVRHALFVLICPCFNQYCFLQVTQHQTLRHFLPHTQVLPSTHSGTSLHTLRHFLPRTQALPSTHSGTSFHTLRHFLPHTQALSSTHSGTSFHTLRYFLPHTQVLPRTQALPSTQSGTSFMYLELGVTQRHTHTHTTHTHTHTHSHTHTHTHTHTSFTRTQFWLAFTSGIKSVKTKALPQELFGWLAMTNQGRSAEQSSWRSPHVNLDLNLKLNYRNTSSKIVSCGGQRHKNTHVQCSHVYTYTQVCRYP